MKTLSGLLLALISSVTLAQPLTLVVGFAPGGASDLFARTVAKKLEENTGRTVIVKNMPGAGGNIAHAYVAREGNENTILLGSVGPLTIAPHTSTVSYNPLTDFTPITMGAELPNILVASKKLGIKTVAAYINKAKTTSMSYGSSGIFSSTHVAAELFNQAAGISLVHAPYKGGYLAMLDVTIGVLDSAYVSPVSAKEYIESQSLVALAVTGEKRLSILPNVPTVAESGFDGYNVTNWYAFLAKSNVDTKVIDLWYKQLTEVLKDNDLKQTMESHGVTVLNNTKYQTQKRIRHEYYETKKIAAVLRGNLR
jgi:tripartite-type tricarboxylate transporter receptor subunit TctC